MTENSFNPTLLARQIASSMTFDFLDAGRILRKVQEDHLQEFKHVAYAAGIKLRRAYYLAEIDRRFGSQEYSKERLQAIGWTKLKTICERISQEDWDGLSAASREKYLAFAEQGTAYELEQFIADENGVLATRTLVLRLTPDQYQLFEDAVLAFGGSKNGKALLNKEEALAEALSSVMKSVGKRPALMQSS